MLLGEKLKREREKRGWSHGYLAEKIPISRQKVSMWESNDYCPDNEVITRLSDIFNLTIDELLMNDKNLKGKIIQKSKQFLSWQSFIFLVLGFLMGLLMRYQGINIFFISKIIAAIIFIFLLYIFFIRAIKYYKNKSPYSLFFYIMITSHITAIIFGGIFLYLLFFPILSYSSNSFQSKSLIIIIFSVLLIFLFGIMYLTFHITSDFIINKYKIKYVIKEVENYILKTGSMFSIVFTVITFGFDTIVGSSINFEEEIMITIKLLYFTPLYLVMSVVIYIMIKDLKLSALKMYE